MAVRRERIGFVGLGIMGRPMARNLLKAGFHVAVTNRTLSRAKPLEADGATICQNPAEVANRSDIVITVVTGSADVEAVMFGREGVADGAQAGLLAIDMSTIAPSVAQAIASRAASRGFHAIDAPVSGGEIGAINATLTIMVGGDQADVARATPVLQALGKSIFHMGPPGAGQATKLANQIAVALNNLGVSEALVFAAAQGLDVEKTRKVIASGAGGSWAMTNYAPKIVAGDFSPGFLVDLQQKDLRLVLDAAYDTKSVLPGTALAHSLYTALQRAGSGREGNHALVRIIERLSGIEARG